MKIYTDVGNFQTVKLLAAAATAGVDVEVVVANNGKNDAVFLAYVCVLINEMFSAANDDINCEHWQSRLCGSRNGSNVI